MLKEYKCCFKGTDAVKWMMANGIAGSVDEAVRFGNRLREQGFIRHVTNSHIFSNKDYYYWFHESLMEAYAVPCKGRQSRRESVAGVGARHLLRTSPCWG